MDLENKKIESDKRKESNSCGYFFHDHNNAFDLYAWIGNLIIDCNNQRQFRLMDGEGNKHNTGLLITQETRG